MAVHWKLLRGCESPSSSFPLLFKWELGATSYTLYLTDMVHCWSESLNRKQIVKRALDLDTSIDPSEDTGQMKLLLSKLQDALEGQTGSSLSIGEKTEDLLVLEATASLPSSLPPLIWPFNSRLMPQESLYAELIVPCLGTLSHLQIQVSALITQLKEKDHVIGRLLGKLRSAGLELNTVFPSVPPPSKRSKGLPDTAMMNSVKGLKEFDEEAWRASPAEHSTDMLALCRDIFNGDEAHESQFRLPAIPGITSIGKFSTQAPQKTSNSLPSGKVSSPVSDDATDDEEFQRQITPESPKSRSTPVVEKPQPDPRRGHEVLEDLDDQSTTDSSDDNLSTRSQPKHTPISDNNQQETLIAQPKKIGIVGGKKTAQPSSTNDIKSTGTDTMNPPRKIGRIGGLSKQQQPPTSDRPPDTATNTSSLSNPPPSKIRRNSSSSGKRGRPSPPPVDRASSSSPSPRETSEDRADRKRQELKRMLDDQSKAPVKKKRKF